MKNHQTAGAFAFAMGFLLSVAACSSKKEETPASAPPSVRVEPGSIVSTPTAPATSEPSQDVANPQPRPSARVAGPVVLAPASTPTPTASPTPLAAVSPPVSVADILTNVEPTPTPAPGSDFGRATPPANPEDDPDYWLNHNPYDEPDLGEEAGGLNSALAGAGITAGIVREIPTLGWVQKGEKLTRDQLRSRIRAAYPGAGDPGVDGLADIIMKFDRPFATGNGDGLVDRREVTMPGVIIGALAKVDISNGLPRRNPGDAMAVLQVEELEAKLNRQIFGRYRNAYNFKYLARDSIMLEWVQFGLRYYLVDRLVRGYGGAIPEARQIAALNQFGIGYQIRPDGWQKLRMFYDHPANLGNRDGKLNLLETLNFIIDFDHAANFIKAVNYSLQAKSLQGRWDVNYHLRTLFPRGGWDLFYSGTAEKEADRQKARGQYWASIGEFDKPGRGGNGDGRIDAGELAFAFGYAAVTEHLFALYDANRSYAFEKPEAKAMLKRFNVADESLVDYFFKEAAADVDLADPGFSDKLDLAFSSSLDRLYPFDFYVRFFKLVPKMLRK